MIGKPITESTGGVRAEHLIPNKIIKNPAHSQNAVVTKTRVPGKNTPDGTQVDDRTRTLGKDRLK